MRNIIILIILMLTTLNSLNAQVKYNILFVGLDDMGCAFDAYGNPDVKAPNYARLMTHGVMFKNTYCQYPLCSPSRTSIFSGIRPDSTGIINNQTKMRNSLGEGFKFLPEYLHDYGFWTEQYGKFTCQHDREISWDYQSKTKDKPLNINLEETPAWWIDTTNKTEAETLGGRLTAEVVSRLRHLGTSANFLSLALSTHNPFTPTLTSWNKIGDNSISDPLPVDYYGNFQNVYGNGSANILLPNTPVNDVDDIPLVALKPPIIFSDDEIKKIKHAYYSEIVEADVHLGVLLDELDRLNAWENTIVVFWSDHGLQMGEHNGQWLKVVDFEESMRVPFVICAPGKMRGVVSEQLVELVDIFSTLTELTGIPTPPMQQGKSLVPLLENPNAPWKKAIFCQVNRRAKLSSDSLMGRAVRTQQFHYNNWQEEGEELYDIINDPFEYTNLALDSNYRDELDSMRVLLNENWQGALPPVYAQSLYYKDADGDGYGDISMPLTAYFKPSGYVTNGADCNDKKANIHPGAIEKNCNGVDDNCNDSIDENGLNLQ